MTGTGTRSASLKPATAPPAALEIIGRCIVQTGHAAAQCAATTAAPPSRDGAVVTRNAAEHGNQPDHRINMQRKA